MKCFGLHSMCDYYDSRRLAVNYVQTVNGYHSTETYNVCSLVFPEEWHPLEQLVFNLISNIDNDESNQPLTEMDLINISQS